jgi:hypothetical protein
MHPPARFLPAIVMATVVLAWTPVAHSCDPGVEVLITELMASNASTTLDENGDPSDWIELYAPCGSGVNLDGWYLTDDPTSPTKWRFPAVQLARGEFLVVFASGKNRSVAGSELHTNFKLSQEGEYLALVRPDGTTVAQAFAPTYPPQFPDVSYGVPQSAYDLIPAGVSTSFHVPVADDASLGTTWTEAAFPESGWSTGPTGLGYTAGGTDGFEVTYYKATISVGDLSTAEAVIADPALRSTVATEIVSKINYLNTGAGAHFSGDLPFPTTEIGVDVNDFVVEATGTVAIPSAGPWTFGVNSDDGFSLELSHDPSVFTMSYPSPRGPGDTLATFNVPEPGAYQLRLVFYERGGGSEVELFAAPGSLSTFSSAFRLLGDTAGGGLRMSNIGALIGTNVEAVMRNVNTSLWSRITFGVSDPGVLDQLILQTAYEDGFVAYLNGTEIASRNAPASLTWEAAATADRPAGDASEPERFDLTAAMSLLQPGANVLAIHALNETVNDPDFLILPLLHAAGETVDSGSRAYFDVPTPGGFNATGFPGVSPLPGFSQPNSFFTAPFALTLSAGAPSAVIRYTLDGSQPTATHGTEYLEPLSVTDSTRIRARVFVAGLAPSPVLTRMYAKIGTDIAGFTSNLPLLLVHTFGGSVGQNFYTENLVGIVPTTGGRAAIVDAPEFNGAAGIKIRGSSSTQFPKKSYALELRDEYGGDVDGAFLGLPAESDWVLYAPYTDKTLMRDVLAYEWSNSIGRYAPRTRFVEAYVGTGTGALSSADYAGVYVIIEKVKAGPARVNITPIQPEDVAPPQVTGGYMLKKDRLDPGDTGFLTSSGQRLAYVEPKEGEITSAQSAYITGYLNQFETTLYGPSFDDPVNGYAAYIDSDAFIDHHWIVEMTKNIDGFRLSTHMFKDRLAKLKMGPVWDYNLTLGNANYLEGWLAAGWYAPLLVDGDYPWWRRLFADPEFTLRYWDRWYALRRGPWRTDTLLASIDADAQALAESQVRNYVRWPILGTYVWPNWYIGATYDDEVAWMKAWLTSRLAWIDGQYVQPPTFTPAAGPVVKWTEVAMSAASGTIHYTVDGTDPRLPGGAIAPAALVYSSPVAIGAPTTLKARTLSESVWSALNEAAYDPRPLAFLNEIIADNATVIADDHGDFDPWIELYNPLSQTVNLGGLYLTDDLLAPTKWAFPANTTLCGSSRLLIWADAEPGEGGLHASFRPSLAGGTVWLLDGQARVMDVLSYPALARNVSYGRVPDGGSTLAPFPYATPGTANSAVGTRILVNEYNAVAVNRFLSGTGSDPFFGRVLGNGGDWFELVVVQDHLDLRGFKVDVQDSGGPTFTALTFTIAPVLADLRSGTIITVSESLPSDASYDPASGDWWINVRSGTSGDGVYITAADFETSQNSTHLTVRDASSNVVFGPAGEGIQPLSGVGNDEIFKLQADPSSSITAYSAYSDGSTSSFGSPNAWSGGSLVQDFGPLRSVVPGPCTTDGQCDDANLCTDDVCVAGSCQNTANTVACDDGNICTSNDACTERQCRGQAVASCCFSDCGCDDGLSCTTDSCVGNVCTHAPVAEGTPCDDANACTTGDVCGGGLCVGAAPLTCNDNNACTTDSCASTTGCANAVNGICSIGGWVRYYRDAALTSEPSAKPVGGVPIDANGDASAEALTDGAGSYALGAVAGPTSVTTLPKWGAPRAADHNNAISSLDAATIAQAAVGMISLSANQAIAGDVSGNGTTSSFDAAMLAQFSVELIDHFEVATAAGSDWRLLRCDQYVSAESQNCGVPQYVHPALAGSVSDDFYAVLYGDVTGNWSPAQTLSATRAAAIEETAASNDRLRAEQLRVRGVSASRFPAPSQNAILTLSGWDKSKLAGVDQTLTVSVTSGDGIAALDLVLRYDPTQLTIREARTIELSSAFGLATNDWDGALRVGLFGVEPIRGSGKLLEVVVRPVAKPTPTAPLRLEAQANEGRIPVTVSSRSVGHPQPTE